VTIVPIKDGAVEPITTFSNGKEVADAVDTMAGLNYLQWFFVDDKMVVAASYDSLANMEAGTAVNQSLFGKISDQLAGAPARHGGEVILSFKGPGKINGPIATRVTIVPLKPGSEAAIIGLVPDIEPKFKGEAFNECIDITTMLFDGKMVVVARYSTTNGMEKSGAAAQESMAPIGPYFAGAPEKLMGTTAWSYSPATGAKKTKAKKVKKGCC